MSSVNLIISNNYKHYIYINKLIKKNSSFKNTNYQLFLLGKLTIYYFNYFTDLFDNKITSLISYYWFRDELSKVFIN